MYILVTAYKLERNNLISNYLINLYCILLCDIKFTFTLKITKVKKIISYNKKLIFF